MGWITCSLCGFKFDPADNTHCAGCVLKSKCETVCCPRCGYETVIESSLTRFAKKIFSRRKSDS